MEIEIQNYPLNNFWQFCHIHLTYSLIFIGLFLIILGLVAFLIHLAFKNGIEVNLKDGTLRISKGAAKNIKEDELKSYLEKIAELRKKELDLSCKAFVSEHITEPYAKQLTKVFSKVIELETTKDKDKVLKEIFNLDEYKNCKNFLESL